MSVQELVDLFKPGITTLYKKTEFFLIDNDKVKFTKRYEALVGEGVDVSLAKRVALLPSMYHALLIIDAAKRSKNDVQQVAKVYFKIIQRLDLIWLREVINRYPVSNHWSALAKTNCKFDLDKVQSQIAIAFIDFECSARTLPAKMKAWLNHHDEFMQRWNSILADLHDAQVVDFAMLTVAIKQLVDFMDTCSR